MAIDFFIAREFRLYNGLWYADVSIISLSTSMGRNGGQWMHWCTHGPVSISKSNYTAWILWLLILLLIKFWIQECTISQYLFLYAFKIMWATRYWQVSYYWHNNQCYNIYDRLSSQFSFSVYSFLSFILKLHPKEKT